MRGLKRSLTKFGFFCSRFNYWIQSKLLNWDWKFRVVFVERHPVEFTYVKRCYHSFLLLPHHNISFTEYLILRKKITPYEEDDDATLHKKLVAAKMARKRAEDDLKLLCNRIGLLKSEEGKVSNKFKSNEDCRLFARLMKLVNVRPIL